MSLPLSLLDALSPFLPPVIAAAAIFAMLTAVRKLLESRLAGQSSKQLRTQLVMLGLTFVGLLVVILLLPITESTRGQLLSLLGILISAAIALSSTNLLGNAMAGLMLRSTRSFRAGDFLRVEGHFGRVSERSLFHVEIQSEDRDLTTLPNLYLITHPVKVVRSSGTMISAVVSLGYEVPRGRVSEALGAAAEAAGLDVPFVHVLELGDFSVSYRVAGMLADVEHLISARSKLRENMLDELHRAGIEIVSPNFMNTRAIPEGTTFIPKERPPEAEAEGGETPVEKVLFDKAEEAGKVDEMRQAGEALAEEIESLEQQSSGAGEADRPRLEAEIEEKKSQLSTLVARIESAEGADEEPPREGES